MLYTNEFDIEGLVATSNLGHGQRVRPELIRQVVDAYGKVRPNLLLHDARYPPAEGLRDGIKAGQPVAGPKVPVAESVGEGKDTEASEWIIRVVDRPDPRPVWVVDLGRLGRPGPGALEGPRDRDARASLVASWRSCGSTPSATRTRPAPGSGSSSPAELRLGTNPDSTRLGRVVRLQRALARGARGRLLRASSPTWPSRCYRPMTAHRTCRRRSGSTSAQGASWSDTQTPAAGPSPAIGPAATRTSMPATTPSPSTRSYPASPSPRQSSSGPDSRLRSSPRA